MKQMTLKKYPHIFLLVSCLICLHVAAQTPNFEFTENKGQWDSQVRFRGNIGDNGAFFLGKEGFTVLLHNPADVARFSHHGAAAFSTAR